MPASWLGMWGGFASLPPAVSLISKNDQTRKREDNEERKRNIFVANRSSDRQTHSEIFEKELPCEAMRDFAAWCRCKASETDGEGSVLKYMTEPESRRQRSRCVAMQTSFFMSARVRWGALPPRPTSFSCLDTRKGSKRKSSPQPGAGKFAWYV